MSLSYAAHINGDKVYDIATGYWIEAKQEAAASAGRMQWAVYLYDDTGTFVEKYTGGSFPEADKDKYLFAGFDMNINVSNASWRTFTQVLPSYSISQSASGTSTTLKQYFSGEQGYAINADYAVIDVQPYSITDNGVYTAPFSKAYSPVTVDVQEQPWQPLEDGYSNFWFELTEDTLSPWLNFSAKNNDAVIDWGDGSGEVALDTLTPTHTYAKAGKYVVKVKGVTGIAEFYREGISGAYLRVLKYVEFADELITFGGAAGTGGAFLYCVGLRQVANSESVITGVTYYNYGNCTMIDDLKINMSSIPARHASGCTSLSNVILTSNVSTIGNYAFASCISLSTIHVQATTPPTLGTQIFSSLPTDFIIYVPVGYGETYKAAAGWSAYADHILEEGQTPNRAMLSRLAKETDTDEDMR